MRKASVVLVLLVVLASLFVSCDSEPSGKANEIKAHKEAFDALGDVSRVFSASGAKEITVYFHADVERYVTGQELTTYGHKVRFEADIVEYNSIDQRILDYVDTLESTNALMHQNYPGFTTDEIDPEKKYVEFATYTVIETGEVLFHEIRIFTGDYKNIYLSGNYYAKSVSFSPDLTVDIDRHIDVLTGERSDYRIPQGTVQTTTVNKQLEMKETSVRKEEFALLGDVNKVYAWYDGDEIDLIRMFGGDDVTAECYLVELNSLSSYYAEKFANKDINGLHQRGWQIVSEEGKEYVEVIYYKDKSNNSSWKSFRLRAEKMEGTTYGYRTKCI